MFKKFFISLLGTIAGLWITLLICGVVVFFAAASIISSSAPQIKINKNSILYIDLNGSMPERYQPASLMDMMREVDDSGESLVDILNSIKLAANDSHIKGIYINADMGSGGNASYEEILNALREFKKSGKWILAYGDFYHQGNLLLASAADSVFLNPMGGVGVHGVAANVPFYTGLLDKIGVKMQIVRVGTFKSAVEPFFAKEMSPASRLQLQQTADTLWSFVSEGIAEGRDVPVADVNMWADSIMSTWSAQRILDAKAVTALRYRRQVEDLLRKRLDIDHDEELPLVTPSDYMAAQKGTSKDKDHVAVLFAVGDIVDSGNGGIVGDKMTPLIIKLADDDNVKGLVLRVNSGGGSAFASEQIWEALEYFKSKGKPFYVSMGDMAASGGYYISCGADSIFADRTTLTGSIGVFGMVPDFSGLLTDKLGITFSTVETNPNAAYMNLTAPMTSEQLAALQSSVNDIYETFTSRVAAGRHMSQDSVKTIAEGRVWIGSKALEIGLVDRIAGLTETVNVMTSKLGLDEKKFVYYPEVEDTFIAQIVREARDNVTVGNDFTVAAMQRTVEALRRLNPRQARMIPVVFN